MVKSSYLGGYDVMNSCMFTCVISHVIGLQVGCSGTIVETLLSDCTRRIFVLSCRWSFDSTVIPSVCFSYVIMTNWTLLSW
jgi:hypothetical protein